MPTEMLKKAKKFYWYMGVNGLLDLLLLVLAAVSANFLSYIYYFDVNALALVDSSSIAKHVLVLSLHYVGALAIVSVLLIIIQHVITQKEIGSAAFPLQLSSFFPRSVRVLVWKLFEKRTLRLLLTVSLFSAFYIGVKNLLILLLVTGVLFVTIVFLYLRLFSEEAGEEKSVTISLLGVDMNINVPVVKVTQELKQTSIRYFMAKVGVIVIYLALVIGLGRAVYVEHNVRVVFSEPNHQIAIVATSSSGMVLYDVEQNFIFFKSWESLGNIYLPFEYQKSLKNINKSK